MQPAARRQKVVEEAPSPLLTAAQRERYGATAVEAARGRLHRRRDGRVHRVRRRPGRTVVSEDEHVPAGGAPGHRARRVPRRPGAGPGGAAAACRRRGAAQVRTGRRARGGARGRGPRVRGGPEPRVPADRRHVHTRPGAHGGEGVRVDSALLEGGAVATTYDPMLAKVVAWGRRATWSCAASMPRWPTRSCSMSAPTRRSCAVCSRTRMCEPDGSTRAWSSATSTPSSGETCQCPR